ncbi:glycosyltransferase [Janibacter terrae]|uniref:glycosyltransferase n=1 Tax=Janibacter terrae TaxID=103817 RepID=UPI003D1574C8
MSSVLRRTARLSGRRRDFGISQASTVSGGDGLPFPRVCVLVAVYEGMDFLPMQLASVLNQQHVDVSVIVSVDLSADRSFEWISKVAQVDPRVQVLPYGERYGSASANFFRLVKEADFGNVDLAAFCDQDDYWYPDKLWRAAQAVLHGPYSGYSSSVLAWYPNGRTRLLDKVGCERTWDHLFSAPGPGCTQVFSSELAVSFQEFLIGSWSSVRNIDYHDWLLYAFARERGHGWFIDSIPGILYRQHGRNQLGANIGLRAAAGRLRQIRRGWYLDQVRLIAVSVGARDSRPMKHLLASSWSGRIWLVVHTKHFRRRWVESLALSMGLVVARGVAGKN